MKKIILFFLLSTGTIPCFAKLWDVFVALELSPITQDSIVQIQQQITQELNKINAPVPDFHKKIDLHITLQFIANDVKGRELDNLKNAVQKAVKKVNAFVLAPERIEKATLEIWPSHLIYRIQPSAILRNLVNTIRNELDKAGIKYLKSRYEFLPGKQNKSHFSIANIEDKHKKGLKQVLPKITKKLQSPNFLVDQIVIKQSVFQPDRRYANLDEFFLAPPQPPSPPQQKEEPNLKSLHDQLVQFSDVLKQLAITLENV